MNYKSKWREEKEEKEQEAIDEKVTWLNIIAVLIAWGIVVYLIYKTMN